MVQSQRTRRTRLHGGDIFKNEIPFKRIIVITIASNVKLQPEVDVVRVICTDMVFEQGSGSAGIMLRSMWPLWANEHHELRTATGLTSDQCIRAIHPGALVYDFESDPTTSS